MYRATVGREVFDEPLEWRVEDGHGKLICTVYDGVTAARIAAALVLAEKAAAGADPSALSDAVDHFVEASNPAGVISKPLIASRK